MRLSSCRMPLTLASSAGAIAAVLALAGTAWTAEAPGKDEMFTLTTVIQVPSIPNAAGTFFSFDISWTDPVLNKYFLADRNNKTIDVIDPMTHTLTQFQNLGYAGVNPGGNDFSGPDGIATVNNHTELWVGDSPGKVWVLNSSTLAIKTPAQGVPANPILVKTDAMGGNASTSRADEF